MDWSLKRLEPDHARPAFDCDNSDLNEFFAVDSIEGARQLISVTYVIESEGSVIAFFSVSNDAIRREDGTSTKIKRLLSPIPQQKRYKSLPAVKIGRLATSTDLQSRGIGSQILDYIKAWFTHGNKTGCRFIVVDANNNPRTIGFYQKNGFDFLTSRDENDDTRLMYFDLITFAP